MDGYLSMAKSSDELSGVTNLHPLHCAKLRDPETYQMEPFLVTMNGEKIKIGNNDIIWLDPNNCSQLLAAVGLSSFSQKLPCRKRIVFIEERIQPLLQLFPEEFKFITDYTSTICWLNNNYDQESIGSAGFYEIPHCTFFSDTALFSVPPEIVPPKAHAGYAIFENFYHEALHHQMHSVSALSKESYLVDSKKDSPTITLDWRNRKFTLLEAIHALHVYAMVTPLRFNYSQTITESAKGQEQQIEHIKWINQALAESLKMWDDLSTLLLQYLQLINPFWSQLIVQWRDKYNNFLSNHLLEGTCNATNE